MNGKEKCKLLRQLRKEIAEANNIIYLSAECTYEGDCKGTCPKCDAEIQYLESKLNEKEALGQNISFSSISLEPYKQVLDNLDLDEFENYFYEETLGMPDLDEEFEIFKIPNKEFVKDDSKIREPIMGEPDIFNFYPNRNMLTIEDLEFSDETYNCLKNAGIRTIEELTNLHDEELIKINSMCRRILVEIKRKVHDLGLLFKDDYE